MSAFIKQRLFGLNLFYRDTLCIISAKSAERAYNSLQYFILLLKDMIFLLITKSNSGPKNRSV